MKQPARLLSLFSLLLYTSCTPTTPPSVVDSVEFPIREGQVKSLPKLHPSQCVWKAQSDDLILKWESVARLHVAESGHDVSTDHVSGCNMRNPDDGVPLSIDGKVVVMPPWRMTLPATFEKCYIIQDNPGNPYNACLPKAESCAEVESACAEEGRHWNFPYCQNGCSVNETHDVTFRVEGGANNAVVPPTSLRPTMYNVVDGRVLARRLSVNREVSRPDEGIYRLNWRVEQDHEGIWSENFASNLLLAKVRAFLPGYKVVDNVYYEHRTYLVLGDLQDGNNRLSPCSANPQDPTEITLDSCPVLARYNPAAAAGAIVDWDLEIQAARNPTLIVPLPDSLEMYLEFTMLNMKADNHATPTFARTSSDIPAGQIGVTRELEKWFRFETGFSADTWTIENLTVSGQHVGDFRNARIEGRPGLPLALRGGSVPISITAVPAQRGMREATVRISLRSAQGTTMVEEAPVKIFGYVPALLTATPNQVVVAFKPELPAGVKKIELENVGDSTLKRQDLTIAGPHAGNFAVAGSRDLRQPVPETFEFMPGQRETLYLYHRPGGANPLGPHQAELQINSTAGMVSVRLESMAP